MRLSLLAMPVVTLLVSCVAVSPARAGTEIEVWHSLTGVTADQFKQLTERFNGEQTDVHVNLVYKGDARATAKAGIEALQTHQLPDLIQVEDSETTHLDGVKGLLRPISEVLPLVKSS